MDNRKARGAGERGAGLQSSAPGTPCSCVTVLPNACRVLFTGDTHRKRRVWGQSRGSSTHDTPQPPPTAAGLGQHMHRPPAQGPATQRRMFPGHTSHRGPGGRTGINRYPRASSDVGKSPRTTGVGQDNPLPPTSALQRHSSTLSPLWTNTPRAFSGQRPTQLNDKINTQVFPGHQPQLWPEGGGRRVSTEVHSLFQAAKTHKADPPSSLPRYCKVTV